MMKLKFLTPFLLVLALTFTASAQITLSVIPDTPLDYLVFELTQPQLKAGYNKRTQYFGTNVANMYMGEIKSVKYSDLPLYSYYSQDIDFFDQLQSKTTISRTEDYVSYLLEVRETSADPYTVYSKDTFFLDGTNITGISETIYDTEDNSVDSYATYNVVYHSNGKIEKIDLSTIEPTYTYNVFGGVLCIYNSNNTLNRDTIYQYGYNSDISDFGVKAYEFQEFLYKTANENQIDSVFYYNTTYTHQLATKFIFVLNTNNEVTTQKGLTYDSDTEEYSQTFYYNYGIDPTLSIVGKNNVKTFQPYPNPTSDKIQLPENVHGKEWFIFSASGLMINKGVGKIQEWDVSSYEKGLYILQLTDGESTWQGKFIVK